MSDSAKAGWYQQGDRARWWNGEAWTESYRPLPEPPPASPPPPIGEPVTVATEDTAARARTAALVMIAGAAAVAVGSFLPWLKATAPFVGTITTSGVDNGGDGVVTLGLAVAIAALALRSRAGAGRWAKIAGGVVLAALVVLVAYEVRDISSRFAAAEAESDLVTTSYGSGLFLMGAGILAAGVGWLQMLGTSRRPIPASHPSGVDG